MSLRGLLGVEAAGAFEPSARARRGGLRRRLRAFAVIAPLAVGVGAASCGGAPSPPLPPLAAKGLETAAASGCFGCHGTRGSGGGVGPAWMGLAGSEVKLSDGSTVQADDVYLHESIRKPSVKVVKGYAPAMPPNKLSDAQIDAIVAYIETLAPTTTTGS